MVMVRAPASRKEVLRVGVLPEVVAVPIPVKMEAQPVADHLNHRDDTDQRLVLRVDCLQLHPWLEAMAFQGVRKESIRGSLGRSPLEVSLPKESLA